MSWAEEDWTVGLSGRVLQKVKELQVHHERLSRENKQKQLLLDNIQTSLEKQTAKYEQVRSELQSSHRELQKVQEEAKAAVSSKERLSLDLQTKHAQVCSLEGQLDAAKTLNNKLTQEVKRLEAELEKLQNSSRSADTTLFSTPCWSSTSPWEHNGSRKEERHGNRDEETTQGLHVRRLQFSDMPPRSTPHRQPPPDVFSTPSAAFPWEREDSKHAARRPSPASPKTPYTDAFSHSQLKQTKSPNNSDSDSSLSELRIRLTDLEEELRVKAEALKSVQNEAVQTKKELSSKELSLQKLRDELSQAHTHMAKESERASSAEQKAKQLLEDLKCQRQNAESSRVQHQQKTKELEKQHQRDLQEFQKERQFMERQHQQEINKLNQELAQARTLHNALQAQIDKVSLQKQALDKEVETLKEKLKWTEGQLQQSQKNEAQTQVKLTESLRETEAVTVSLKQSQKKERGLEEDLRRLTEERDDAQRLIKELQAEQKAAIVSFQPALQSYSSQPSLSYAPQPSTQARRPPHTKSKREEAERRSEIMPSYPTDREPGEGIDSEHISDHLSRQSESLQIEQPRTLNRKDAILDPDSLQIDTERATDLGSKQVSASADLQAENAALRSELRDVREELQKRLDDLEAQRRAETEARTRLKQLSRKNANQVTEKEEQYKECKAQLEKERIEVEKLKKTVATLETEIAKERQEKDKKEVEGDKNNAPHDREEEMIELNIQLKKQLSEVKAQLALEREERQQEEEERMNKTSSEIDLKKKIEELESEIEQLKASKNNISQEEEAMSVANSPLTYLTLREDEMNSNVVTNKPEQLMSSNQRNTMLSQAVGDYIQPDGTLSEPQEAELNQENNLSSGKELIDAQLEKSSEMAMQVQHLQRENAMEKERANQYQIKLEALQNQVTQQTKQLTMAFEKQSQHISGLLVELQVKESTLISAEEELQQYKQELNALKTEMNEQSKTKVEKMQNDSQAEFSIANNESLVTDNNATGQEGLHLTSEAEVQTEHYVDSDSTIQQKPSASDEIDCENKEKADISIELLKLQQENHLLKLKLKAQTAPEPLGINTDVGNGGELPLDKLQTPIAANDDRVQACTEESSVYSEEPESEEHPEAVSQRLDQISFLQQQVVALQTKLQALSEENQQKTQELALWRLSSEPAPVFVQSPATTESDTVDQGLNSSQSHNKPGTEPGPDELQYKPQQSNGCVTFVREDEVLLSCSTNKLQGRTLFSRLQHNVISEPRTPRDLHELIQDNSESDKENTSPTHHHQRIVSELVTKEVHRGLGVLPNEVLDGPIVNPGTSELKNLSINRYIGIHMKCVSTQTEILLESPEILRTQTQTEILQEGEEEEEVDEVDSLPVSTVPFLKGQQSKVMLAAGSFPIPADPASLAERIRRNRTQLSAAFDDTEYEPYGLPEVVMKGFADIPSGPSCPYIVRRGLLGTTAVPVPSKNTTEAEETD